jgi:hypothetical protein
MANSNNSIITGRFKGMLNKEVVFRDWAGLTVVAKAPRSPKGEPTNAQLDTRERFLVASKYGRAVKNNPDQTLAEAYAKALRPRQNVYSRAVEDCLSAPKVRNINLRAYTGAVGNAILVNAVDDFRVVTVQVYIYSPNGSLLETGFAEADDLNSNWMYITTAVNNVVPGTRVLAIATDVPGNEGTLEVLM